MITIIKARQALLQTVNLQQSLNFFDSGGDVVVNSAAYQAPKITQVGHLLQKPLEDIVGRAALYQSGGLFTSTSLFLEDAFFKKFVYITQDDFFFTSKVRLHPTGPVITIGALNTFWPFRVVPTVGQTNIIPVILVREATALLTENVTITATGNLNLIDVLGPSIENEVPLSGSTFVNPDTEITFDLVDTGNGINNLETQIYVNGYQLVEDGVAQTVSGFGYATFTKVSDFLYQFRFIKDIPFGLYETVTVSGSGEDLGVPVISGTFNYWFRTWDKEDFTASISGSPDVSPPFLVNLSPQAGELFVSPDTDIVLEIHDLHTGVNLDSVNISVLGNPVVISGIPDHSFATTSISGDIDFGRSYKYIIEPNSLLPFNGEVDIDVYAEDLYNPPNILSGTYSFYTFPNTNLVVSGLSVLVSGVYEILWSEESLPTYTPTSFRVVYTNLSSSGVSTSGSYVEHNGSVVSGVTFTPVVSGQDDSYYVDFDIDPYYEGVSRLHFYIEQEETISGVARPFRDFYSVLQWGYQFCYDPGELEFDTTYTACVRVCDKGDFPSLGSDCWEFQTIPMFSQSLSASITAVPINLHDILAQYYSVNPFFEYGKTMELEFEASDFDGNTTSFVWYFTIEDR